MKSNFYNINNLLYVPYFKNGHKIHIKKQNRGKFTEYCGGNVTDECIQRGKNSSDPKIRKRATFAANARKWSKKDGGTFGLNMHSPSIFTEVTQMTNHWYANDIKNKKIKKNRYGK